MAENYEYIEMQEMRTSTADIEAAIDPLETLSSHPEAGTCLAGPSQSCSDDTSTMTDYEDLDWNSDVLEDCITDPVLVTNPNGYDEATAVTQDSSGPQQSTDDIEDPIICPDECIEPLNKSYTMDNLYYLLQTEKKILGEPRINKEIRFVMINFIIDVNGSMCRNPAVVQLACSYLDAYLSVTSITEDDRTAILIACFWIANKFHGIEMSGNKLTHYSEDRLKELVAAERKILMKLKFREIRVAHDFVPYLSWCCDSSGTGVVEEAAEFLCQCAILVDHTLNAEYPSVLAAAAVRNALILMNMTHSIEKLTRNDIYMAATRKTANFDGTCAQLRAAVRVMSSSEFEYKALILTYSRPPHYIASKITWAINDRHILLLDDVKEINDLLERLSINEN